MSIQRFEHPREWEFAAARETIQAEIEESGGVVPYLTVRHRDTPMIGIEAHQRFSQALNPTDPNILRPQYNPDEFLPIVRFGMVMGADIAHTTYTPEYIALPAVYAAARRVLPPISHATGRPVDHRLAETVCEVGERGLAQIGYETVEWMREHEPQLNKDIRIQRFYSVSAGIAIMLTQIAFDDKLARDRATLAATLDTSTGIDWDSMLRDLP